MDKVEEVKEREPLLVAQFLFHPMTGEITFQHAPDISIAELLRIKSIAEERINVMQLSMTEASFESLKEIAIRLNRLNDIENKLNATLSGLKVLLQAKEVEGQ